MFDISFSELLVIAVVALLVIGPEKLPKLARTAGAFAGRMQRFVAQVKDEVNREARFEELQRLQQEVKAGVAQAEHSILDNVSSLSAMHGSVVDQSADGASAHTPLIADAATEPVTPPPPQQDKPTHGRTAKLSSSESMRARTKVSKAPTNQQLLSLDLDSPERRYEEDLVPASPPVKRRKKPKSEPT